MQQKGYHYRGYDSDYNNIDEACFGKKVFLTIVNIKVGFLPQKKLSFQRNAQQIG
ncbi:hypothetical protein HMPREF1577_01240 [Gardnerella pickettii JCP8017A]|uniref:Uncharacterized protein n=1 Tax=Gardnerella pickettii JCP8017A TaxID=1261062 RepID=T2PJ28_9BIFI|nr:hypothetical protein HMPREF1577_01240 [Gardnerella pickettii JCP8017A]EPI60782.1 hypothetical protein HMPREF1578_01082 [Gardnerella pickettii JCP8017B]